MLRDKDDYEKDSRLCEHILSLHAVSVQGKFYALRRAFALLLNC